MFLAAVTFAFAPLGFEPVRAQTAQPELSSVPTDAAKTDPPKTDAVKTDPVKADYDAAERIDSLGGWDVFLAQHPTGDYTAMAQERRAKAAARLAALPGPAPRDASHSKPALSAKPGLSYLGTVECSAKFQAAKLTGKLDGRKWNDFRAAECGPQAARASLQATAPPAEAATAAAAAKPAADAVFPSAIDPKYAKDFSDKGRMRTCADQFKLNKAGNANGGMKWIDKGGGYYAECNRRLKGA
jgi:hypothetical protein